MDLPQRIERLSEIFVSAYEGTDPITTKTDAAIAALLSQHPTAEELDGLGEWLMARLMSDARDDTAGMPRDPEREAQREAFTFDVIRRARGAHQLFNRCLRGWGGSLDDYPDQPPPPPQHPGPS